MIPKINREWKYTLKRCIKDPVVNCSIYDRVFLRKYLTVFSCEHFHNFPIFLNPNFSLNITPVLKLLDFWNLTVNPLMSSLIQLWNIWNFCKLFRLSLLFSSDRMFHLSIFYNKSVKLILTKSLFSQLFKHLLFGLFFLFIHTRRTFSNQKN